MTEPAFLFSADWHVCRSAWSRPKGITGDAYFALRQVVDLAIALDVPLLAGGDIYDTATPHPADVRFVRKQMARLRKARLPVYYIRGQHDGTATLDGVPTAWMAAASDWPTHVDRDAFEIGHFRLYGLDWRPAGRLQKTLAAIDAPEQYDFLLCHEVWQDLMGGHGGRCDGKFSDVPGRMHILTGDFHRFVASPRATSPGALHMLAIDEPDDHYAVLVRSDATCVPVAIAGRERFCVDLADAAAFDAFVADELVLIAADARQRVAEDNLPSGLRRPLLRVRYAAGIPDAYARLVAACAGMFHLFAEAMPADGADADAAALVAAARASGPLGSLAAYNLSHLPEEDREIVRAAAARLWSSSGPIDDAIEEVCRDFDVEPGA
jgi:hypothetical protein